MLQILVLFYSETIGNNLSKQRTRLTCKVSIARNIIRDIMTDTKCCCLSVFMSEIAILAFVIFVRTIFVVAKNKNMSYVTT